MQVLAAYINGRMLLTCEFCGRPTTITAYDDPAEVMTDPYNERFMSCPHCGQATEQKET